MSILQTIILGLLQGLTEFLPISSSGHLYIARILTGWEDPGVAFDAAIHIGTLIASLVVFREEIMVIIRASFKNFLKSDVVKIAITALPALVVGFLLKDIIDSIKSPIYTALSLIALGVAFLFITKDSKSEKTIALPNFRNTLLISLSQILAYLPGTSRSGVTILAARLLGIDFKKALYTSFIIGIPVIAAAGLWGTFTEVSTITQDQLANFAIAIVTSLFSGYGAGIFLKNKLASLGLRPFGVYRIALGAGIILTQLF